MRRADNSHRKVEKKAYAQRSDLEKLASQWKKLTGLHEREEPSAAIVRCATAAEIAANYAIRTEWANQTEFDAEIVDAFLLWANGIQNKIDRLFVPIYFARPGASNEANALKKHAKAINSVRNGIVHQGKFANKKEAATVIAHAEKFINLIVGLSKPEFNIAEHSRKAKAKGV